MTQYTLQGKVVISGQLKAETALHIGAASTGLEIGGVDKVVVRNPLDNLPYVPGSSLKGKLRALLERASDKFAEDANRVYVKKPDDNGLNGISMHLCNELNCMVCTIFGRNNVDSMPKVDRSELKITNTTPTRLLVRDGKLKNPAKLQTAHTDLPYTEVKWEVGIDRITSAANPRQLERVPAGAEFECEMIYTIYDANDRNNLREVFKAMHLLEDDYLGGHGSRGSGKVKFEGLIVDWRPAAFYASGNPAQATVAVNGDNKTVTALLANFAGLQAALKFAGE